MKIAITGYGKMGHIIEQTALGRGHEIVCRIDKDNRSEFDSDAFGAADCVIEFSTPSTAFENIMEAFSRNKPVVCGTTGWLDRLPEVRRECADGKNTFLFSSNFSVGVNIFMALNRYLSRLMERFPQYTPRLTETHHIHKLDHPSGTAITLAEQIIDTNARVCGWEETGEGGHSFRVPESDGMMMEIDHIREGEVPGIHTIDWDSPVDYISITHSAKSREGFALGAVMAAEWLIEHRGFHTIDEVFDFK